MLYANYILIRLEEKLFSKVSKCYWKMVFTVNTGCFNLYLKMQYLEEEQKSKKNVEADSAFFKTNWGFVTILHCQMTAFFSNIF